MTVVVVIPNAVRNLIQSFRHFDQSGEISFNPAKLQNNYSIFKKMLLCQEFFCIFAEN